jgi:hypothetical protein
LRYLGESAECEAREGSINGPHLNEIRPNAAELHRGAPPARARKSSPLPTVIRAILVGACVAIGGGVYTHFTTGAGFWLAPSQTDRLTDAAVRQRQRTFEALGPLSLQAVPSADVSIAVDGMRLSTAEKDALLAASQTPQGTRELQGSEAPAEVAPAGSPERIPATQAASAEKSPPRLAWITLWDTDVQDGDVVRIDSQGYSRTITLTKRGETFAVPVPANGIVTVTGIKDGDGGGITVGLASGGAKAVFPIMSTGQSLGLRVTID